MLPSRSSETSSQFWIEVVDARAHQPADQRGEHHLVDPVVRLAELAQPPAHRQPGGHEGEREADAEGLQVERADARSRAAPLRQASEPLPTIRRDAESGAQRPSSVRRRSCSAPAAGADMIDRAALREAPRSRAACLDGRARDRCPLPESGSALRAAAASSSESRTLRRGPRAPSRGTCARTRTGRPWPRKLEGPGSRGRGVPADRRAGRARAVRLGRRGAPCVPTREWPTSSATASCGWPPIPSTPSIPPRRSSTPGPTTTSARVRRSPPRAAARLARSR